MSRKIADTRLFSLVSNPSTSHITFFVRHFSALIARKRVHAGAGACALAGCEIEVSYKRTYTLGKFVPVCRGCHDNSSREFISDHAAVGTGSRRASRRLPLVARIETHPPRSCLQLDVERRDRAVRDRRQPLLLLRRYYMVSSAPEKNRTSSRPARSLGHKKHATVNA